MPNLIFEFDPSGVDVTNRTLNVAAYSGEPVRSYYVDWEDPKGPTIVEVDEVIESWDLSRFQRAPVLTFAHDNWSRPTIGRADEITSGNGGRLDMVLKFDVDEFSESIWRKYRDGFMFGFSVEFARGTETIEAGPERPLIRLNGCELLALSAVNIGRDSSALVETAGYEMLESLRSVNRKYAHIGPDGNTTEGDPEELERVRLSAAAKTLAAARKKKYQQGLELRQDAEKAAGLVRRFDRYHFLGRLSDCERLDSGAVRVPAALGRVGVLKYKLPNGTIRRELRLPEEVFSERSLTSLQGAPVTENHVGGMVTPETWKEQALGHAEVAARQDDRRHISGSLVVSDKQCIEKCDRGDLLDISPGYMCSLEYEPGVYEGEEYDAIQRGIVHNHVALLPPGAGRQGDSVGLRLDAEDAICVDDINPVIETEPTEKDMNMAEPKTTVLVRLDGKDYEKGSDEHIAKIESIHATETKDLQAKLDAANTKLTTDVKKVEDERDALQAKLDAAEEGKNALQAKLDAASNSEAVEKRVTERLELERKARLVFGDDVVVKQDGKDVDRLRGVSDLDIMKDAIRYDRKDFDFEGKSEAYIQARFDGLVENAEDAEQTHQNKGLPAVTRKVLENQSKLDEADKVEGKGYNQPKQRFTEPMQGSLAK